MQVVLANKRKGGCLHSPPIKLVSVGLETPNSYRSSLARHNRFENGNKHHWSFLSPSFTHFLATDSTAIAVQIVGWLMCAKWLSGGRILRIGQDQERGIERSMPTDQIAEATTVGDFYESLLRSARQTKDVMLTFTHVANERSGEHWSTEP
jgi:hypothetical protein